jgi:hypothetical protein
MNKSSGITEFRPKDRIVELAGFPIYKQETDHTCGPCAVRMTLEYLGLKVDEAAIARRCLTHPLGALPWTLVPGFNSYLSKLGKKAEMVGDAPDVYERIVSALQRGIPTIFIYAVTDVFHPPKKVTHYGIATGIDEPAGTITAANPFGCSDKMPLEEWWDRFSIADEYAPSVEGLAVKLGILKPRTAIFISDK